MRDPLAGILGCNSNSPAVPAIRSTTRTWTCENISRHRRGVRRHQASARRLLRRDWAHHCRASRDVLTQGAADDAIRPSWIAVGQSSIAKRSESWRRRVDRRQRQGGLRPPIAPLIDLFTIFQSMPPALCMGPGDVVAAAESAIGASPSRSLSTIA
jgi:hypothetical protein